MGVEREVRIGLVGCGRLAARGYMPALQRATGVRLAAVADVDRARAAALAAGVPLYDSARALVAAGGIDAVVVATPTRCHVADASAAADAALPALVEKPPGLDAAEAARLAALRPAPRIGFNRRFDPELVRLREDLASAAGVELLVEMRYRRRAWQPFDMRDDALLDLAPHLIDLTRWLTRGEIARVRTRTLTPLRAVFELELSEGRAFVHCAADRVFSERVEIRDGRRRLVARYRRGGLARAVLDRLKPWTESALVSTMARQLDAFGRWIRHGGDTALATAADGVAVMATIDAVRRSAAAAGWCRIEEPEATR